MEIMYDGVQNIVLLKIDGRQVKMFSMDEEEEEVDEGISHGSSNTSGRVLMHSIKEFLKEEGIEEST